MITIHYGFKTIDEFIDKLNKYILDPGFEEYGNFIIKNPKFPKNPALTKKYKGWYQFFGNFFDYSNAFSFLTDDENLVKKLRKIIRDNQKREEYQKAKSEILEYERKYKERLILRLNGN
jgi:hypothetical protein